MTRVCAWSLVVALSLGVVAGCGDDSAKLAQGSPVEELVMDIADASAVEADFKALFADGATVPDEKNRKRYGEGFWLPESCEEGPEENTMTVKVCFYGPDSQVKGRAEWKAVKQGEVWKLQEAPLPE